MYEIKFSGYASIFNTKDYLNDIILPYSFLKNDTENIILLYEHNLDKKIGSITNMYQNEIGLYIEGIIKISDNIMAYDILNGNLNGLSIGYTVKKYYYKNNTRIITELELLEISIVLHPANKYSCIDLAVPIKKQ